MPCAVEAVVAIGKSLRIACEFADKILPLVRFHQLSFATCRLITPAGIASAVAIKTPFNAKKTATDAQTLEIRIKTECVLATSAGLAAINAQRNFKKLSTFATEVTIESYPNGVRIGVGTFSDKSESDGNGSSQ